MNEIQKKLAREEDGRSLQKFILPTQQIIEKMLAFAWYPSKYFQLNFGAQDKVGECLQLLDFKAEEKAITNPAANELLIKSIGENYCRIKARDLERYVPYRLLTPFFEDDLKCVDDGKKNKIIIDSAREKFVSMSPPLY